MEEEERESGITFGEICRLIGKKIWLVLGSAALVTVLAVVLFAFVLNPMSTYYSMSFSLVYPMSATGQYPDGTPFSYRNIISRSILEDAKNSDERLKDVDINAMLLEDHISVTPLRDDEDATAPTRYRIEVKGSYFRNHETAQLFIRCIGEATVKDIVRRASDLDFGISKETFNGNNFEARLDLLAEEYETLLTEYDNWQQNFSAGYRVTVRLDESSYITRSLSDYRAEVNGLYSSGISGNLRDRCESGGYGLLYGDETTLETVLAERVAQLQAQYKSNEKELEKLYEAYDKLHGTGTVSLRSTTPSTVVVPDPTLEQRIAYYAEQNAMIYTQLGSAVDGSSAVDGTLSVEAATAFSDTLNDYFDKLNEAAELLGKVTAAIYSQNTFAEFDTQNANSAGDTSIVLVGVAAFVLTFLIAAVAVCAVQHNRARKSAVATPGEDAPEDREEN